MSAADTPPADRPPAPDPELRPRAEQQLRESHLEHDPETLESASALLHELRVHQIELEMQNDELRRTQEELETSRSRYVELYDSAAAGYLTLDGDGRILEANLPAAALLAADRDSLTGRLLSELIARQDQDIYYLHRRRLLKSGERDICELRLDRSPDESVWARLEAVIAPCEQGHGSCARIALNDITAQKAAEIALAQSEQRYRSIFEAAHDAIALRGRDGRVFAWNPAAERLFDVDAATILAEPPGARDWGAVHEDGSPWPDSEHPSLRTLATGEPCVNVVMGLRRADELRWISITTSPVLAEGESSPVAVVIAMLDVTEQRRVAAALAELNEVLEERVLQRTSQLETANNELEAFVYSASHDLRAPLRAIDGFSQMIVEDAAERLHEDDVEHLQRVRSAARRMALLIDHLLSLSRSARKDLLRAPTDLSAIAAAVLAELRGEWPERKVDAVIKPNLVVDADSALLHVILTNLLANAWKFSSHHDTARIEVGARDEEDERVYFVKDDGDGFDPAQAKHLFGAFQRYHSADDFEGDGIGLATVQRLVARHGGRIWAESAVGRGATFYFTLPPAADD